MDSQDSLDDKTLAFVGVGRKVGQGRFTLERLLGQGAMGAVWLAVDARLSERVALKFVPPAVRHDPAALDGLRREAQRSHRLTHPNIVRIHDFHEPPGEEPFISMEFVEGRTFSEWRWSEPQKCLSWEKLSPLVRQLCEALGYAHGEGVVHRDLKPANLMLDTKGRLKLADFGLATVIHESLSKASGHTVMGGTPAYMSPQQVTGKAPGVADDIYSLGVTLYELLTSHPPFFRGDISYQAVNETPLPMREQQLEFGVRNPVPLHVEQVIMSCLEKDPARRPPGAPQIAERLYGEPSSNPNVAPGRRGGRGWLKIATASLCVLLVVGAYFWFHGNRREEAKSGMDQNLAAPDASSEDGKTRPAGQTGAIPEFLAPETGFESIFNGKDLSGWDGDTNVWTVQNGTLMGRMAADGAHRETTDLQWRKTTPDDFELRFSWRHAKGYALHGTVDFGGWLFHLILYPYGRNSGTNDVCLYVTGVPGGVRLGERLVVDKDGVQRRNQESLNDYAGFETIGTLHGWNESAIIVRGSRVVCMLNGLKIAEFADEASPKRPDGGVLALGLETNPDWKALSQFEFKNVRLKRLNGPDSYGH